MLQHVAMQHTGSSILFATLQSDSYNFWDCVGAALATKNNISFYPTKPDNIYLNNKVASYVVKNPCPPTKLINSGAHLCRFNNAITST